MVGRTYRYFNGHPLYPFGYGLSYTKFSYKYMTVQPTVVTSLQNVTVKVIVTNEGKLDSDEVCVTAVVRTVMQKVM